MVFVVACSSYDVSDWDWSENAGIVGFSCENTTNINLGVDFWKIAFFQISG